MNKNEKKSSKDVEEIDFSIIEAKKKSKFKKRIIRLLIISLILIIIIIFPMFFYKKEVNSNILSQLYKKGAFHVHSVFSDGTGSISEISKAANLNKLDFVLMTDHGKPNVKCSNSTAWDNKVLIIGGSEFSLNSGHLASAGYGFKNKKDYIFPPEPQEAINDVNKTSGISFVSHPLDGKIPWTDWDIKGFSGVEILNSYSSAKKTSIINILTFPLQYLFNKNYALLNTVSYPKENLKLWDDLNKKGDYFGIYALDAHSKLPITRKLVFKWPSYRAMFNVFTVYVKTGREFKADPEYSAQLIIDAIKKGNFFSVIEAIAPANGFEMFFIEKNGKSNEMGSKIQNTRGDIVIKLPFNFNTDVVVKKDGKIFKELKNNYKKELRIKIDKSGTYRVEVFVSDNSFNKLPWILTNPFFIGTKEIVTKQKPNHQIKKAYNLFENSFKIEKNKSSEANLLIEKEENINVIKLDYFLKNEENKKDFWIAIAQRKIVNFSGYSGIVFKAKSDKARRFWLELRTNEDNKELSYRHSFLPEQEWKTFFIPFAKLHLISGDGEKINLSKINALFFAINNALSYKNKKGILKIKDIGLY